MEFDNSNKRLRSPGGSAHLADSGTPDMETKLLNAIADLSCKMDFVICSLRADFDKKLADLSDSVNIRLNKAASVQAEMVRNEVAKLDDKISKLPGPVVNMCAIETRIDFLERAENLNILVVKGVPFTPNESIPAFVTSICDAVNFRRDMNTSILSVYRMPAKRNDSPHLPTSSTSQQIIMRFGTFDDKQHFFSCYLKSKLNASHFGFKTSTRVYVNEKLTRKNFELLRAAVDFKNKGKLYNYHTFRGLVFVRVLENSKPLCVSSKKDFAALF